MVELPRTASGRRVRRRRVAASKTEALRLLREMHREVDKSGTVSNGQRSIAEAVEDFWQIRLGTIRRDGTLQRERWMLDVVLDGLGRKRVSSLSVNDCDEFLRKVATGLERPDGTIRRPIGRAQVRRISSTLKRVINNELRLGYQTRNVAALAEMPETPPTEHNRRALTVTELGALLDVSAGYTAVFVDLVGRNGMRPQEARAIQWHQIDWERATLDVGPQMDKTGEIVGPKTKRAVRTISVDQATIEILSDWRDVQADQRVRVGRRWVDRYQLVISTRYGTGVNKNNMRRSLSAAAAKAGITGQVKPYDLRHTAITLQSKLDYSDWQLADWAGTSERMINDVYRQRTDRVVGVQPLTLQPAEPPEADE